MGVASGEVVVLADGEDASDHLGTGDDVRNQEKESAKSAIDRQFELACRVFAIQQDISNHWKAVQGQWQKGVFEYHLNSSRNLDNEVDPGVITDRFESTMAKTRRAARLGHDMTMRGYGVSNNNRRSNAGIPGGPFVPGITDIEMSAATASTHGIHNLVKYSTLRYYQNDDNVWENVMAGYHASRSEPDAIFSLLAHAQSTYASVAASVINQQQQKSGGGSGIFSLIGGVVGGIYGGPAGAAAGSAIGSKLDG